MSDYEIQEIRRIRREISAEHGNDLKNLAEYYRKMEQELRSSGKYKFFGTNPDSNREKQVSPLKMTD